MDFVACTWHTGDGFKSEVFGVKIKKGFHFFIQKKRKKKRCKNGSLVSVYQGNKVRHKPTEQEMLGSTP